MKYIIMLWNNFFDKYGNFDNKAFYKLLKDSKKNLRKRKSNKKWVNIEISLFNRVSQKELWQFVNKLSTFINSWIDLKWALNIISKQTKSVYFRKVINEIKTSIDYWIWMSESMIQYPKIFDNLTIALIWVWEKTWSLWKILDEMDNRMLESIELKWKVKWALIYPVILLILTISMVTFMMVVIIPKITSSFQETWTELPYLTQIIINISDFIINEWIKILLWLFSTIVSFILLKRTYIWEIIFWYISIRLPIFWYIIRQSNIIYFINSFTMLMDSWVLLLDSLKTSSNVVPNIHYRKEIVRIKNEVESWLTMSKSLWLNVEYETNVYLNKLFPEEFAYIVNTWEETWTLSESLRKIWRNYNFELKRYIWNLATMLEPIIIVIVWALVWVIVIAIMLPFFNLWKIAQKL